MSVSCFVLLLKRLVSDFSVLHRNKSIDTSRELKVTCELGKDISICPKKTEESRRRSGYDGCPQFESLT